jgi:hypothetical protein
MSVVVKYNNVELSPGPMISGSDITNNYTGAGSNIGCMEKITLEGFLYVKEGGFASVIEAKLALEDLFKCEGILTVACDDVPVLEKCVRPISISFSESLSNYIFDVSYTIELENTSETCCEFNLKSRSNKWSMQEDEEINIFNISGVTSPARTLIINHDVSASAYNMCIDSGEGIPGWMIARDAVNDMLGFDTGVLDQNSLGVDCFGNYKLYNHIRKVDIDQDEGDYNVSESWIFVQDTGDLSFAKESFTVEFSSNNESRVKTASLNGTIQGYEDVTYDSGCRNVLSTKYENALTYFEYITGEFYDRIMNMSPWYISSLPTNSSYSHSPIAGTINYNLSYDSMSTCFTGECDILKESIETTHNRPTDIFGEHQILGRPCPLIQPLGMKTRGTRGISINIVMDCGDICDTLFDPPVKPQVEDIIQEFYEYITGEHDVIMSTNSSESWDPYRGTYSRSEEYAYTDCC